MLQSRHKLAVNGTLSRDFAKTSRHKRFYNGHHLLNNSVPRLYQITRQMLILG